MQHLSSNNLATQGEMVALVQSIDWSATPLGCKENWSQSLQTAVTICLNSRFPMVIWWGRELILIYNDAWRPILGPLKHPRALGRPGYEMWQENWEIIGAQLNGVLNTGQATWSDDLYLPVNRYGYIEEAYFTYSYSPIIVETGEVGGVFTAVTETTERVIGERHLRTLRELGANTSKAKTVEEACDLAIGTLSNNPHDVSFALLYLIEAGTQARLVGTVGIETRTNVCPLQIDLTKNNDVWDDIWNLGQVFHTGQAVIIDELAPFDALPNSIWGIPASACAVMPIVQSGQQQQLAGFLVMGISPQRAYDDVYQRFFELVAGNVATAIANADAYEAERRRAEALAELDKAKTTFFSNVSHELRTPLTLMLSPLEDTLLSDTITLQQRETLELVHRNGLRLLKLVNTLLDFSRIEAGRVQAVYEPTDLAALTAELASVFRSAIEKAGLQLIVNCSQQNQTAYVDRQMWEKIVLNLISNALKFTFTGEIEVSLHLVGDNFELKVRDTGIGIESTELTRLFERFYRVEGARGRSLEGSGIGLSFVQELVKLHGGYIHVESVVDVGTCFTVSIKRGCAHLPSDRISATRSQTSTAIGAASYIEEALRWLPSQVESVETRYIASVQVLSESEIGRDAINHVSTQHARILLADDNSDMRDYVKRLLSENFQVEAVADGVAALAAVKNHLPDLVLTDVMMPGLDGFGLLHELRANPETKEIPVIMLSARAGEESRVEGIEAGADDYLVKPFSARELLVRVTATLNLARLRKQSLEREQVLRKEVETINERLIQLLESMTDAYIAMDRDWRIIYQNAAAERINGKPRTEVIGKTHWQEWSASVGTNVEYQYRRAMEQQVAVHFEHRYYQKPFYDTWLEIHAYPMEDGLNVFYRDITERKQAEEALIEGKERLEFALDVACLGEWNLDLIDKTAEHSLRHDQIFGYESLLPEWTYEMFLEHVLPEDRTEVDIKYQTALLSGEAWDFECRIRRVDGAIRWIWARGKIWRDATTKKALRIIGTIVDITERKEVEAELQRLLQQEQAARETAEAANRIKDEFLAVLSHELRSPLNPILGWSKILQSRKLDEAATKNALQTIERNAQLQTKLIDDLLDVSRILRGKLSLNMASVNLVSTIEAALETVRLAAEAKNIQIHTHFNFSNAQVLGDSARLQQIIWNLLSNAVKFTPQFGQVNISLNCVQQQAQISVSDNGIGINPEFLPYIFEYFRQEDSATTRKFGGLGLGLAIVKYLTELHGGTVQAESLGEEQGATFTVKLPIIQDLKITNETNMNLLDTPNTLPLNGINILVVDDDADNREFFSFVLEESGAIVATVSSGSEALQLLRQYQPNIILSDIGMPEMDGYKLIQEIRNWEKEQNIQQIPAIALTAYAGEINQQQALAAGFQLHIAKPVDSEQLLEAVCQLVVGLT